MLNAVLSLILVAINIWVLVYLFRLESIGCKCAMDWRRTYVIAYLIVSIVYSAFVWFLTYRFSKSALIGADSRIPAITLGVLSLVMLIAGILYIVFGMQYISRLREEKCECSDDVAREVWEVVLYIHIAFLVLGALMILLSYSAWGFDATRDALLENRPLPGTVGSSSGSGRKSSSARVGGASSSSAASKKRGTASSSRSVRSH